jgi:hypothetical protein
VLASNIFSVADDDNDDDDDERKVNFRDSHHVEGF